MIKNIVLDMGNVCCKWDVSYIASQLASSLEEKDYIIKHLFQTKQCSKAYTIKSLFLSGICSINCFLASCKERTP